MIRQPDILLCKMPEPLQPRAENPEAVYDRVKHSRLIHIDKNDPDRYRYDHTENTRHLIADIKQKDRRQRMHSHGVPHDLGLDELDGEETGQVCLPLENLADAMVLQSALEILKEEERQIVLLHASAGLKHREIASSLHMPLATVLSKYNRAVKKLKQYLREE